MKPFGDFFFLMRKSCTAYLGLNNNDFYILCLDTFDETDTAIGMELAELTEKTRSIMGSGLSLQFDISEINPTVPGRRVRDDEQLGSPDSARVCWSRYVEMGNKATSTINYNVLLGLALILYMISTAQEQYELSGYNCFEKWFDRGPFKNDKLINWICDAIGYNNTSYIDNVKQDKQYLLPFLISALLYCRKWQVDGEKPEFDIVSWLDSYFNSCINLSNDERIAAFQKEYYSELWNKNKTVDIRDMVDGAKLSSISKNAQISNLYVIPPFLRDDEPVEHPINDGTIFSYLVVANTGCGKSTFLQAIVTANIYEKVSALQIASLSEEAKNTYQWIKEQLGFSENYFPILVKANSINQIDPNELRTTNLLDLADGSQCTSFRSGINHIVRQKSEGKILLLVDALDEIDGIKRKKLFGKVIEKFLNDNPNTNIILTSRPIEFQSFHGNSFYDKHDRISFGEFGNKEIEELISKWIKCDTSLAKDANIKKKYQCFVENEYLSRLASNPFILSHALHYQAHHVDNATPQKIISYVITNLIKKRWPSEKYEELGITDGYMREVLANIAWHMAYEKRHVIPSNNIVDWFHKASQDIAERVITRETWDLVVKEITARSGLIVLEDKGYVFQDDIIECYLASEWIVSTYNNSWMQEENTEFFVLNKLQDVISYTIDDVCWEDILIMTFSPDENYDKKRLDKLTLALLKYLLLKAAETMNRKEIEVIGNVFINVVRNTFGKNHITNANYESGMIVRRQIVKFLHNYSHIIGDSWKERDEFTDAYEFIKDNGIINIGGLH